MRILVRNRFSRRKYYLLVIMAILAYLIMLRVPFGPSSKASGSSQNYFQYASRLLALPLLVDSGGCKIPDFDVLDQDVLPFMKIAEPGEKCSETHYNWTRVDKNQLILNRGQIEQDGYSLDDGFCCYKVVERVTLSKEEQNSQNDLEKGDHQIKYSPCIEIISDITQLQNEFIMVECGSGWKRFLPYFLAYRAFHGSATVQGSQREEIVQKKINYWKKSQKRKRLPPNILIIGIDSTTRLNFRRQMPKTRKILQELQAVEMLGYTKVGENTFPNFIPLMTGYSEEDLTKICYESPSTPQDSCPHIWKRFDGANYITAHSEDSPGMAIYNYWKTGFIRQPVDYYLRPLFLSAHDYGHPPLYIIRRDNMDCIGQETNDEVILSYVESVLDLGHRTGTPVHSVSWSSQGSHSDLNYLQLVDHTYATFIKRILDKGILENTILIFMGDHGYRFGHFRQTVLGYYEDKLPNLWIALPPWIREEFPEWQKALETNSRRLTTPFTLYWTLNKILEKFSSLDYLPQESTNSKTGQKMERKHVQNFLQAIPEDESRTCGNVGVAEQYCPCYLPQDEEISLDDPLLVEAAVMALTAKNRELLATPCSPLEVSQIFSATLVRKSEDLKRFVIAFTVKPGNFVVEAGIDYFAKNKTFRNHPPSLERISALNSEHIKCIKDVKMERFCYCRRTMISRCLANKNLFV